MQPVHCSLRTDLWNLPPRPAPLFFRVPKATSRRLQTLPSAFGLLLRRRLACVTGAWGGSLWNVQPVHCSLRTGLWNLPPRPAALFFRVPKATFRRLQTLPSAFGLLLHRSLTGIRREPREGASGTCSPCTAALELSLWNLPPRPPSDASRRLAGCNLIGIDISTFVGFSTGHN